MKTYNYILFSLCLVVLFLASCNKQAEFKSHLHILSFINPDQTFEVRVQKSAPSFGDHSDLNITNACVVITNSSTQEDFQMEHVVDGVYRSNGAKPLAGYDYEIQVKVDGFEHAAATTYIPDLGNVVVNLSDDQIESGELSFTFSPTMLSNKPSNFFAYELIQTKNNSDEEEGNLPSSEEPDEESNGGNPNGVNTGNIRNLNYLKPVYGPVADGSIVPVETINTFNGELEDLSVRIVAVSSEFYDFLLNENQNNSIISSSVRPYNSPVYSNFVGDAYGLFGGFSEKTIKFVQ